MTQPEANPYSPAGADEIRPPQSGLKFLCIASAYIIPMAALSGLLCYRAIDELTYFDTLWPLEPLAGFKLHWALQLFIGIASLGFAVLAVYRAKRVGLKRALPVAVLGAATLLLYLAFSNSILSFFAAFA